MNLRQLRFHMGMSVESLARRLNVHPRVVIHREAAPIRYQSLGDLLDHCRALGADVGLFMIRADGSREPIGATPLDGEERKA